jgi:AcrR family transcriptional regulator
MKRSTDKTALREAALHNPRSERNRRRLLDAAIAVLLGEGGQSKFTSAQIAHAAGLHKPAFYAHFKNVDECMQAVALEVARANVREMLVLQTQASETLPLDEALRNRLIEQLLNSVRQHESLYRLLRRYQFDEGALGEAIGELNRYVLERWTEHFWRLAVHFHIDARHFREIEQLAEHVVALSYISISRVLDGRVTDLSVEAARVARYGFTLVETEFKRMARDKPIA